MNKKLREFLVQNGLRSDATEQEAWAYKDELETKGIKWEGKNPGTRSAAPEPQQQPQKPQEPQRQQQQPDPVDVGAEVQRALQLDAQRREDIEDRLRVAGLLDDQDFSRSLINNPEISLERASQEIFKKLKERNQPIGNGAFGSMSVGTDAREKLRTVITDGLALRCGHRLEQPAEGANAFRGRTLVEICRELMEASGVNTRSMNNRELAQRAIAAASTSDLPYIFSSLVNRNLLAAYNEWPQTFRPFVAVTNANDFRSMYAVKLSGAPDLQTVNENGEYKVASLSDSAENYKLVRKGIKIPFTFEMIINDDLRALTRAPNLFGAAARRMEGDAVYGLITANGNMSDGYALFSSTHSNLAGTAAAITSESLSAGRAAMRKQTGLKGESIDIQPAFVVAPVVMETNLDIILMSSALPTADMSSGVRNPWSGKLTPICDPRLDVDSLTAWYLFASPNQAPVIEIAYLMGEEQPFVDETMDFHSDGMWIKVRHIFGAGVVDYVGGYMNAGA